MSFITIKNNQTIPLNSIPELEYNLFMDSNIALMDGHPERHCVQYFGFRENNNIRLLICIADDTSHTIMVSSSLVKDDVAINSFSAKNLSFEKFEREIHENFGIPYSDHPWL